jgi:hypothetical protein
MPILVLLTPESPDPYFRILARTVRIEISIRYTGRVYKLIRFTELV